MEKRYIRKDGDILWARLNVSMVSDESGALSYFIAVIEDIDLLEEKQASVVRLNRALGLKAECNRIISRATDEEELLHLICREIVESAGYSLAWVGYVEHDAARIRTRQNARRGRLQHSQGHRISLADRQHCPPASRARRWRRLSAGLERRRHPARREGPRRGGPHRVDDLASALPTCARRRGGPGGTVAGQGNEIRRRRGRRLYRAVQGRLRLAGVDCRVRRRAKGRRGFRAA
jgi:hypothetical protein